MHTEPEATNELIQLGRQLAEAGFTWATSGNLSLRTQDGFAMTASGSRLPGLRKQDVIVVDADGKVVKAADGARPSKEAGMHLAVYRRVSDAEAVLHVSPPYSTYLACTDVELPAAAFPEGMMHLRNAARVPYEHAGSAALAAAVEEHCTESQVLILDNHGTLAWGQSPDEALLKLEVLEFAAKLAVLGRSTGIQPRQLDADRVADFLTSGYRR